MKTVYSYIILCLIITVTYSCEKNDTGEQDEEVIILPENRLPQVKINTNGATIVDEPKIIAQMTITINDEVDYDGNIGIEIRGSSSQSFPKKQFGFETRDDANEDLDVSLLGFPEE